MRKSETSHFDVQTGRIVRHDVTKGKTKMTMTDENGAGAAEKRTDKKVRIDFLGPDGTVHKHPVEGCRKIVANFIEEGGEPDTLDLSALNEDMIYRLAAFGASTLGRNEVNTTKPDEGAEVAADACRSRFEGFRNNSYRSVSSGSATPIILLALQRAMTAMGVSPEKIEEKVGAYRKAFDEGEDEKAVAANRRKIAKDLRGFAEVRDAEAAIKQEREQARLERAPKKDFASLLN